MKVNRPEIINLINKIYRQEQLRNKSKPGESVNASPGDRVEISSGIEVLKKEITRLEETDPSRLQRIAGLSHQIEAGEYKVGSRELAAIILRAMKERS
jgi:anti-sigma28 factor (negative regulator of flagellin synthesis)